MIPYAERNEKFCKVIELLEYLVFSNREIKKFQRDTRRAVEHRTRKILIDSFTENLRGIIMDGNETSLTTQKEKNTNRYEIGDIDSNRLIPLIRTPLQEGISEVNKGNTQAQKEDNEARTTTKEERNIYRHEIEEEESNRLMSLIRTPLNEGISEFNKRNIQKHKEDDIQQEVKRGGVEEVEQEILNAQVQKEDDIQKEDKRCEIQKDNIQQEDKNVMWMKKNRRL